MRLWQEHHSEKMGQHLACYLKNIFQLITHGLVIVNKSYRYHQALLATYYAWWRCYLLSVSGSLVESMVVTNVYKQIVCKIVDHLLDPMYNNLDSLGVFPAYSGLGDDCWGKNNGLT